MTFVKPQDGTEIYFKLREKETPATLITLQALPASVAQGWGHAATTARSSPHFSHH
jgi:hypothetical protein